MLIENSNYEDFEKFANNLLEFKAQHYKEEW